MTNVTIDPFIDYDCPNVITDAILQSYRMVATNQEVLCKELSRDFMNAVAYNYSPLIDLIFAMGLNGDYLCHDGRTALTSVICVNNLEMVKILLDRGADPNKRDGNEKTPMDYALEKNHLDIADLLIEYSSSKGQSIKAAR